MPTAHCQLQDADGSGILNKDDVLVRLKGRASQQPLRSCLKDPAKHATEPVQPFSFCATFDGNGSQHNIDETLRPPQVEVGDSDRSLTSNASHPEAHAPVHKDAGAHGSAGLRRDAMPQRNATNAVHRIQATSRLAANGVRTAASCAAKSVVQGLDDLADLEADRRNASVALPSSQFSMHRDPVKAAYISQSTPLPEDVDADLPSSRGIGTREGETSAIPSSNPGSCQGRTVRSEGPTARCNAAGDAATSFYL